MDPGLELCYQLEEDELLECFRWLDSPREGRARAVNEGVLLLLAALFALLYAVKPQAFHYMVLVVALLATLLAVRYLPQARRRRRARRMARQGGTYRLELRPDGRFQGAGTPVLELGSRGDHLYEGPLTFTLLLGKEHRFCIPKRILTDPQQRCLRTLLEAKGLVQASLDEPSKGKGRS